MRSKGFLFIAISCVTALILFVVNDDPSAGNTTMEKKNKFAVNVNRTIAYTPSVDVKKSDEESKNISTMDPLNNAFVNENKKHRNKNNEIFKMIESEKRHQLGLQLVGNSWAEFSELEVSLDSVNNSLFTLGPYKVSRKLDFETESPMKLVFNENQKTLGVLTGRLVVTVRDLIDINPIAKDYDLKLENLSAEIKTAYLNQTTAESFDKLNAALKTDVRIEHFYFEIVRTDWMRN